MQQQAKTGLTYNGRGRGESASVLAHYIGALNRLEFPAASRPNGDEVEGLRGAPSSIIAGRSIGQVLIRAVRISTKTALILSPITRGAIESEIVSARRPQRARDRNRMARANKWGAVATSTYTAPSATKTEGQEWIRLARKDQDLEGAGRRGSEVGRFKSPILSAPRVYSPTVRDTEGGGKNR